jgi:transposase-like protein
MMRKQYSPQQKAKVVLEVFRERQTASQIASAAGVHPVMLTQWKKRAEQGLPTLFERATKGNKERSDQELVDRLYGQIGQLQVENTWLKKKFGI